MISAIWLFIVIPLCYCASNAGPPAPKFDSVHILGNQESINADVGRDLGFSGKIGDTVLYTYGDSHKCGYTKKEEKNNAGVDLGCALPSASDGVAKGTGDPLKVRDYYRYLSGKNSSTPRQFCPYNKDEPHGNGQWAIGITTIIPVSDTEGMLFFLLNNRTTAPARFPGSGVATITFNDNDVPICTRLRDDSKQGRPASWWWSHREPHYGATGAVLGNDGYIYGFGGGNRSQVFLTRVPQKQYNDFSAYTYWNGSAYTPERLNGNETEASVFKAVGQATVIWSPFFNAYLMLVSDLGAILASVSKRPEGPWSNPTQIFGATCAPGGCSYAPVPQPWWDDTGKSLVVSFTVANSYDIRVINVTWQGVPQASPDASPYSPNFKIDPANIDPSPTSPSTSQSTSQSTSLPTSQSSPGSSPSQGAAPKAISSMDPFVAAVFATLFSAVMLGSIALV